VVIRRGYTGVRCTDTVVCIRNENCTEISSRFDSSLEVRFVIVRLGHVCWSVDWTLVLESALNVAEIPLRRNLYTKPNGDFVPY
jgi:hypothetical protein